VPGDARSVLKIDPVTLDCSLIGDLAETGDKWQGGFLAKNGVIFCIPENADRILRIVPPGCGGSETERDEYKNKKETGTTSFGNGSAAVSVLAAAAAAAGPVKEAAAATIEAASATDAISAISFGLVGLAIAVAAVVAGGLLKKSESSKPAPFGKPTASAPRKKGWASNVFVK